MKVTTLFEVKIFFAAVFFSGMSFAGEAKVNWQAPENYSDIQSNYGSKSNFQKSLFKTLDAKFSERAARLPEGNILEITVTNLEMAGEMRSSPSGIYQRTVQSSQFPQMTLDYKLIDSNGVVIASQKNVIYKDLDFYSSSIKSNQAAINESYYYEGAMIEKWFDDTFKLAGN